MAKKTDPNARLDAELLETARDLRGTLLRKETADKITMRVLGRTKPGKPGAAGAGRGQGDPRKCRA